MSKARLDQPAGSQAAEINSRSANGLTAKARGRGAALRQLPAVEKVLQALGSVGLPRAAVVALVRKEIAALRREQIIPEFDAVLKRIRAGCARLERGRLQPVINGTGILLHTNLGRAPLGTKVIEQVSSIAGCYNNLEYDLVEGQRGGRAAYLESNLALLCRAEAATVVNNCAAALVLALRHFTREKPEVIISRGELVQIGGGFRIPEILEASGARLREVGTTNQTSIRDYARAVGPRTGLILKVHRSNFVMDGFVDSPGTPAIAVLAAGRRVPFLEDLGSGSVVATESFSGLAHEPTPVEILKQGADLVTFSGDKLFGGAQAGIIVGKGKLIARLKREPFFRALRCDKLILAALEATVDLYLDGEPEKVVPLLALLRTSESELRSRAERLRAALLDPAVEIRIGSGKGQVGGGSLPTARLASVTIDFKPLAGSPAGLAARVSSGSPPVIGYVSGGWFRIDLRTVFPSQDGVLSERLRSAWR